jgi:ribosomal protein L20
MPRVKRGTVRRAKRKKLLGLAKGYYANKSKLRKPSAPPCRICAACATSAWTIR